MQGLGGGVAMGGGYHWGGGGGGGSITRTAGDTCLQQAPHPRSPVWVAWPPGRARAHKSRNKRRYIHMLTHKVLWKQTGRLIQHEGKHRETSEEDKARQEDTQATTNPAGRRN